MTRLEQNDARLARRVAICIFGAALSFAALTVWATNPGTWQVQAETAAGDLYIAGEGSSCKLAWRSAVIPPGTLHVRCVKIR